MIFQRLLDICLLVIVIFMAPGCRREQKQPTVQHHDQSQLVRSIEAKFFDLYIPFGITSRDLLNESSDSSIVQLRYGVGTSAHELAEGYVRHMDAYGWVLKADIPGNPHILFFRKPLSSCVVYIQSAREQSVVDVSMQQGDK